MTPFRPFTVSLNGCWTWLYWCNEAGLLSVQIGPVVVEIETG
jgi:hypothetical protein